MNSKLNCYSSNLPHSGAGVGGGVGGKLFQFPNQCSHLILGKNPYGPFSIFGKWQSITS